MKLHKNHILLHKPLPDQESMHLADLGIRGVHRMGYVCHAPIPGPTGLADSNLVRGARTYTGTLYLNFFFKAKLVPVGMAHIL